VKPNLSHLRVFGCIAYCHIPAEKRNKLEPKAIATLFIGYDEQSKAYRCWNPVTKRIIISRDIRFDEQNFVLKSIPLPETLTDGFHFEQEDSFSPDNMLVNPIPAPQHVDFSTPNQPLDLPLITDPEPDPQFPSLPNLTISSPVISTPAAVSGPRRSQRIRKQSVKLGDYHVYVSRDDPDLCFLAATDDLQDQEPELDSENITFEQATTDPGWRQSMINELDSIYTNDTWKLESPPTGVKPINCQWIFKLKSGINGGPPIKKARLVAMGNEQRDGIDHKENSVPERAFERNSVHAPTSRLCPERT
jgi:hypothetical protein